MPPESCGKRCITMDAKRIALFEVKLLSRDKVMYTPYKLNMHVSLWRHLWLQTSSEENQWFQVTPESLNTKGATEQMKVPRCLVPVISMKINVCPKLYNVFKCHVALNNFHKCSCQPIDRMTFNPQIPLPSWFKYFRWLVRFNKWPWHLASCVPYQSVKFYRFQPFKIVYVFKFTATKQMKRSFQIIYFFIL